MTIDAIAGELYRADPDEFVTLRTAAVQQARAAGERALATATAALKRPTRSAWLVNLLVGSDDTVTPRLGRLAAELAAAHGAADLPRLRALTTERSRLVDTLTRQAVALGVEAGYLAAESGRAEVAATLSAAIADPAALEQVRGGRLVKPLAYAGFRLPMTVGTVAAELSEPPTKAPAQTPDDGARRAAHQELVAAEDAAAAAEQGLAAAGARQRSADEALDRASQELADLRAELRAAEAAESVARAEASAAAEEANEAATLAQIARARAATAAKALARLAP